MSFEARGHTDSGFAMVRMPELEVVFSGGKEAEMLAALRFIWNATRGHRLAPWRSEYVRWRVETYSGQWARTLTMRGVLGFFWTWRWELLKFLHWTGAVEREARNKP